MSGHKRHDENVYVVEPDEGGHHAYCPALRHLGAVTQGATDVEALGNIKSCR